MTAGEGDPRFAWLTERLGAFDQAGLRRRLRPRQREGVHLVEGRRRWIDFGSNDYLGLAAAPLEGDLAVAGPRVASSVPRGAGASPLLSGHSPLHQRLCDQLAELEQTEAAVLMPSGFAACSATVAALAEAGDVILSDALNHASLIDGCRLSGAERFIYPHRDVQAVEQLLAAHRHRFQRAFLVTDAIFSMDGHRAPLAELVDVAERYDALMIVDEAHATGVLGADGSGLCEEAGVKGRVPIRIGTLSKALGSQGGFVAGPRVVIDYLIQRARPLVYSTAAAPATIAAALAALRVVREEPQRRQRLCEHGGWLSERLAALGVPVAWEGAPILPVRLGEADRAAAVADRLSDAGLYVPAIRPPTVPEGTARLRISLSASHQREHLEALADAIGRLDSA